MRKEYSIPLITLIILVSLLFYRMQTKSTLSPTIAMTNPTTSQRPHAEPPLLKTTWQWVGTKNADGTVTSPSDPTKFRMILEDDKMHSTTDCNTLSGEFISDQEVISFAPLLATEMYCANSQESVYSASFPQIASYHITGKNLRFTLIKDLGTMQFEAVNN